MNDVTLTLNKIFKKLNKLYFVFSDTKFNYFKSKKICRNSNDNKFLISPIKDLRKKEYKFLNMKLLIISMIFLSACTFQRSDLPDLNETEKCESKDYTKTVVLPDSFKTPWVIKEVDKLMEYYGFKGKDIRDIDHMYFIAINNYIMQKVMERLPSFESLKQNNYEKVSSNMTFDSIQKGDVILTVTRNPSLMAIDGENVPHHALLCVRTPENYDDEVFITSDSGVSNELTVSNVSLNHINNSSDKVIVMRLYDADKNIIDKATNFAQNQIGKPYNTDFTAKYVTDSYYCSQLVWRAFYETGIDIDYDSSQINDYGLVLSSDIFRSSLLYIVDFSE